MITMIGAAEQVFDKKVRKLPNLPTSAAIAFSAKEAKDLNGNKLANCCGSSPFLLVHPQRLRFLEYESRQFESRIFSLASMRQLLLMFLLLPGIAKSQVNDDLIRQKVLNIGIIDSEFIFGEWNEKDGTETHLKYLGQVTTKSSKSFKVMNSIWLWGLSCRATSRILFFDFQNRYVGEYFVSTTDELPNKLTDGRLIFANNKKDNSNRAHVTVINLRAGLPKQFLMNGDLLTFATE